MALCSDMACAFTFCRMQYASIARPNPRTPRLQQNSDRIGHSHIIVSLDFGESFSPIPVLVTAHFCEALVPAGLQLHCEPVATQPRTGFGSFWSLFGKRQTQPQQITAIWDLSSFEDRYIDKPFQVLICLQTYGKTQSWRCWCPVFFGFFPVQ